MTRVFPDPAPASMRSGPSRCSTASRCSGLSFSRKFMGEGQYSAARLMLSGSVVRDPRSAASRLAGRLFKTIDMSKHINVNPGQYKVAGREKMGKPVDDTKKLRPQAADSRKKGATAKRQATQHNKR